jgi:iron complex outermembrane receptor protein
MGEAGSGLVFALAIPTILIVTFSSMGALAQNPGQVRPTPATNAIIEEIVVTARRREENLLDVPLAVTALSGDELEQVGAIDLIYLSQTTPNATIEVARGTNNSLAAYIRGVGRQDHIAGFENGVGLYVDDVYYNRPQLAVLQIYDVERIEVLRGPQGTLYGRNTIGGAIKYITRRLGENKELSLRGRVGSYGMRDAIVTASAPLDENLRVGGSLASFNLDGFGDNLNLPGMENYNKDISAARASVEWLPGEDWFIRLAADWQQDDSDLRQGHRMKVGRYSGAPVLADVFDTRAGNIVPIADAEASGLALLAEWAAADQVTFRSILASRRDETWRPGDFDSLPTVDVDVSNWDRNRQETVEFQAIFTAGRWSGVAGLFLLDASAVSRVEILLGTTGMVIGRPGLNNLLVNSVDTSNWAAFTDLSYAISDHWAGSLGGRFTHDERNVDILRQILVGGLSPFYGGSGIVASTPSDFAGSATFEKFTPRATLQWQPHDHQNVYISYNEGFKGGGFDPRGLTTLAPDFDGDGQVSEAEVYEFMKFEPEEVASFEVGWKATLFEGRMSSRLAAFSADYTDVQIPGAVAVDNDGDGIAEQYIGITTNAADAEIDGLEWEAFAILAEDLGAAGARLELSWAVGLIDADFNEFIDENGNDVANESVFANTPGWTFAATVNYAIAVAWFGRAGELALIPTVAAFDDQSQYPAPDPLIDQGSYALWDLSVVWSDLEDHWQIGLHGKNLTDRTFKVSGLDIPLGLEGNTTAYFGNPRQIWLDLRYRFN